MNHSDYPSRKGFRYEYKLTSSSPLEIASVGDAHQYAGWIEVGFIPDDGPITHIIFEWQKDSIPIFPHIDFP